MYYTDFLIPYALYFIYSLQKAEILLHYVSVLTIKKEKIMKKALFSTLLAATLGIGASVNAAEIKKLPQPDLLQNTPSLMELLNTRQSESIYDKDKKIDDQTLSEILWAAYGMNKNGKRTIATARNEQNLKVFVLQEDGIWFYNAPENQLEKISDENAIAYTAEQQKFVLDAPIHLIYTSSDTKWGNDHAGSAYQNVYLYATAKGLATVIRGLVDFDALHKALKLADDEFVIVHQPIGYAK